jgi:ABC-type transport system involved in Fe-S cluster assembly fused permease/ATPase subunit
VTTKNIKTRTKSTQIYSNPPNPLKSRCLTEQLAAVAERRQVARATMGRGGHGRFYNLDEDTQKKPNYWKIGRKLLPLLWPDNLHLKARVIAVGVTLIFARVANLMVPQLYKQAIDALSGEEEKAFFPTNVILIYTCLRMFTTLQRDVRAFIWLDVEQDTSRRIKLQVFSHLHALSHQYHLSRKTGEVLKVMERGASSLQSLLNMCLFTIMPTMLDLVLVCLVLWLDGTGFVYSAIIALTMSTYIVMTLKLNEWRKPYRREMIEADNAANDRSVNSLINFETVKFFGMEQREVTIFEGNILGYNQAAWKNEASLYAMNGTQQAIIAMGAFACMMLSGYEVIAGTMTVGEFVMIQTYLTQLATPLHWLGTAWRILQQGFIDMEKMLLLLEVVPDIQDTKDAKVLEVTDGCVRFDRVTFSYDPLSKPVLNEVSFEIRGGDSLAFVGVTGVGKSTVLRLLLRFYDLPDTCPGSIRIDGQDVRKVTQESLRQSIGVVPQDAVLFNESVRYNITYGRPDATDKEVIQAAKDASVYDAIMGFPKKLDTKVGERGLRLSGGEKQRIAIARTILKNPKLVVLDEATSALDSHTEAKIQDALDAVCQGRTTLIIAHRLSTVINATGIAVLKDGAIAEIGSHAELVDRDGLYASMWKMQQQDRDGEGGEVKEGLGGIARDATGEDTHAQAAVAGGGAAQGQKDGGGAQV